MEKLLEAFIRDRLKVEFKRISNGIRNVNDIKNIYNYIIKMLTKVKVSLKNNKKESTSHQSRYRVMK